ncbi:MAG: 5'-nucleotidase C-terminal domain-containing protein [Holophaga sp.]|nr:5'-nucleotidase C-terminal domain-containing protein [Holophaga sp.]
MKRLGLLLGTWSLGLLLAAQAPRMERGGPAAVGAAVPDDPELATVIAPYAAEIHASFGRVIAQAPAGMKRAGAPGEFPLGFFLADIMREGAAAAVGGEVRAAFTNAGGIRRDLAAGPVHVGDIYEVVPFEDDLVVAEYSGAEVVAIVKEAIERKGGEPVSGILASVTGSRDHPLVSITWSDGSAIDPAGRFRIATSDYLLANGDATPTLKRGRDAVLTSRLVRQLVIDFCARRGREGKPILAPAGARYRFSPDLAQAIQARAFRF